MSDRPPFYNPSYPGFPGAPPGGLYPHLNDQWRPPTPPSQNPMYPGYPSQPVGPSYPAGRPDFDYKGKTSSFYPPINTGPSYPGRSLTPSYNGPSYPGRSVTPSYNGSSYPGSCVTPSYNGPSYPGSSVTPSYNGPSYPGSSVTPSYNDFGWTPPSHCSGSYHFVPSSGGSVPPDAVHGGQDQDGGPIFVGRAYHDGDLVPAKICPSHGCAFISFAGQEVNKMHYEVLCSNSVAWKYSRDGQAPVEAIKVGTTTTGEPLYVGRTMFEGTMTPGKVHPSHGCLYIPFAGSEMTFKEYEILVLN